MWGSVVEEFNKPIYQDMMSKESSSLATIVSIERVSVEQRKAIAPNLSDLVQIS